MFLFCHCIPHFSGGKWLVVQKHRQMPLLKGKSSFWTYNQDVFCQSVCPNKSPGVPSLEQEQQGLDGSVTGFHLFMRSWRGNIILLASVLLRLCKDHNLAFLEEIFLYIKQNNSQVQCHVISPKSLWVLGVSPLPLFTQYLSPHQ